MSKDAKIKELQRGNKKECEQPEKLKGKPEDYTPEQIKECHGDVTEHPCFDEVSKKLELAGYFFDNLKALAAGAGCLAYVKYAQLLERRANLDGFFFEIVSAKDFFLQKINDNYAGLAKNEATDIRQLKICLKCKDASSALEAVKSIEKELSHKDSWLWKLNNYRNSATHRELLHLAHTAEPGPENPKTYLFKDPENPLQGPADIEVIPYCDQSLGKMRSYLEELYSNLSVL